MRYKLWLQVGRLAIVFSHFDVHLRYLKHTFEEVFKFGRYKHFSNTKIHRKLKSFGFFLILFKLLFKSYKWTFSDVNGSFIASIWITITRIARWPIPSRISLPPRNPCRSRRTSFTGSTSWWFLNIYYGSQFKLSKFFTYTRGLVV